MGQREVIEFLEKEYHKNRERTFTKYEIKKGTPKNIGIACLDHSLSVLTRYGEIYREIVIGKGNQKTYKYRYVPNGSFKITDLRNGN